MQSGKQPRRTARNYAAIGVVVPGPMAVPGFRAVLDEKDVAGLPVEWMNPWEWRGTGWASV